MELKLTRDSDQLQHRTFGQLFVDGAKQCETLEDPVREVDGATVENWKVKGDTAIPRGRYRVVVDRSEKFSKRASAKAGYPVDVLMPHLLNVPGFEGIRIHSGNTEKDVEGCILVGTKRTATAILESRIAFNELFADIREALANGEQVWIEVA